jgi:cyclopropane-fatty-acyl-phospholipid synthase
MNPVVRALTTLSPVHRARSADLPAVVEARFDSFAAQGFDGKAFDLRLPDGATRRYGRGPAAFCLRVVNARGAAAIAAFDELAIAEAYLHGDLDIEGDVIEMLRYRDTVMDLHPIQYLVSTYLEAAVSGQVSSDERWIKSHYDVDAEFFVLWLDKRIRGYSHGFFERDDESLEDGMERKFRYAMKATGIKPGDRVLDIGGGWGSFLEFAGKQGVHVTSVTISEASVKFMTEVRDRLGLPCKIVKQHLLAFEDHEPFDAIVNLGVTEHLPDYLGTVRQYEKLLKPGGRVYLDAYSGQRFRMPSFVLKWVYEGNTSPLNPKRYFAALEQTSLEVMELVNDRHNYFLTCKKWAENLEAVHDEVERRWGELLYRRFRLYLWASANSFLTGTLCAHHMVLEKPARAPTKTRLPRSFRLLG